MGVGEKSGTLFSCQVLQLWMNTVFYNHNSDTRGTERTWATLTHLPIRKHIEQLCWPLSGLSLAPFLHQCSSAHGTPVLCPPHAPLHPTGHRPLLHAESIAVQAWCSVILLWILCDLLSCVGFAWLDTDCVITLHCSKCSVLFVCFTPCTEYLLMYSYTTTCSWILDIELHDFFPPLSNVTCFFGWEFHICIKWICLSLWDITNLLIL